MAEGEWPRNHRYASIVCNPEKRRIVTLLPDREPEPGSLLIPQSRSSPATVAADMAKPRQKPCRTRYRSRIVSI